MLRFILGIVIIIGGLVTAYASAARDDTGGMLLGLGFMIVGALIGASGGTWKR
jgi:hypothetical protein